MTTQVSSQTRPIDKAARFVQHITQVCERDPGRRAALRRGLGRLPEQAYTMHAIVAPWLPDQPSRAQEYALYTVAAMIAANPAGKQPKEPGGEAVRGPADDQLAEPDGSPDVRQSLGVSLGMAVRRPGRGMNEDTAEKRLHLLVRQSLPGVHRQLPGVVRHIHTLGVAIGWPQLVVDLSRWSVARDAVAKRWLQDFYRTLHTNPSKESE